MTRQELISELANHNRLGSKAAATEVLDNIIDIITREVSEGNDVYLGQSFGGFTSITRAPRSGVANGVAYTTPAKKTPKFKPSAAFKSAVV